uniref:Uncharacterized protein n=1 Tax=blood disease bacterium R229 TaxID=741978 RepID=G2ZIZ1_9RALS|nr:conserved hypothetical protein [blood disease bacterium R229]
MGRAVLASLHERAGQTTLRQQCYQTLDGFRSHPDVYLDADGWSSCELAILGATRIASIDGYCKRIAKAPTYLSRHQS